jgi:hypothetical protein
MLQTMLHTSDRAARALPGDVEVWSSTIFLTIGGTRHYLTLAVCMSGILDLQKAQQTIIKLD